MGTSIGDTRGKSTGLETMMGRLFVERGYVTNEELQAARNLQEEASGKGDPRTLGDILIENEYITQRQFERMRQEVEVEKTTQQIPGYQIIRKLGSGAMATVFLAKQLSLDRLVAIKVLPTKFSTNEKFIERFYKEGRAAAQLNHRNIVAAYDVGQAGDHHYFVMEYVDGETVYDRLLKKKRIREEEAIQIVRQVAEALVHAHGKGFIHRDIKPKNIMIAKEGTVKLADLGLARAVSDKEAAEAEAGRAYGTPYYISPEQIRGKVDIDQRADIYGLGATFYHMVTGKVPYEGRNPSSVMHKHLKQPLVPPDHVYTKLNPGTAQVVEMMMAKSRRDRYQTARDLIVDLERIARGEAPHFAHGSHDLPSIAANIEKKSAPSPVAVHRPTEEKRRRVDDPILVGAAMIAVISILLNIVLAGLLMNGDRWSERSVLSDGSPPIENRGPGGTASTTTTTAALLGAWESTRLTGGNFDDGAVDSMRFEFDPKGTGKLIWRNSEGDSFEHLLTWDTTGNTLTTTVYQDLSGVWEDRHYRFEISGRTLKMDRVGGSSQMTFRRDG